MNYYMVTRDSGDLCKGELITESELERCFWSAYNCRYAMVNDGALVRVQVSSHDCFWSFGCRFPMEKASIRKGWK